MRELDRIEILRKMSVVATEWGHKQAKATKGEDIICDELEKIGYSVMRYPILDEGHISIARKKQKLKESRFPDGSAMYHGDGKAPFGDYFFFDAKYKTKSESLGLVNKVDYDGYFKFIRSGTVQVSVKIFFYIKETKQLWIHNLRNPQKEPNLDTTIETMQYGTKVYRMFDSELSLWKSVLYTE